MGNGGRGSDGLSLEEFKRTFGLGDDAMDTAAAALHTAMSGDRPLSGVTEETFKKFCQRYLAVGGGGGAAQDAALVDLFCDCVAGDESKIRRSKMEGDIGERQEQAFTDELIDEVADRDVDSDGGWIDRAELKSSLLREPVVARYLRECLTATFVAADTRHDDERVKALKEALKAAAADAMKMVGAVGAGPAAAGKAPGHHDVDAVADKGQNSRTAGTIFGVRYECVALYPLFTVIFWVRWAQYRQDWDHIQLQEVAVAKGAGLGMTVGFVILFMSKLRLYAWTALPFMRAWFDHTELHAHMGFIMFVLGSIHTVAHFASWEFHAEMYRCWIAGVLLYLIFAVITYTAVKRVGKGAAYRPFVWIHNLQNLVLPLAVLHVPFRWYVLGVLCFIALLHECMKWRRTYVADLSGSSRVGASTSLLSVVQFRTGGILATVPGAYYRIKIPALSVIEWHPFSLSSSDIAPHLEFLVKDLGKWTGKLGVLLQNPRGLDLRNEAIMVQGPYWAPAVDVHHEPNMLLVAAGIGITPYLSILHRLTFARRGEVVEQQRVSATHVTSGSRGLVHSRASAAHFTAADADTDRATAETTTTGPDPRPQGPRVRLTQACLLSQRATLIWTVRDLKLLDYFVSYIVSLATEFHAGGTDTPPFKVKLYFTGGGRLGVPTMVFNALAVLHYSRIGKAAGDALEVHIGRPDVEAEIAREPFTGAYYCGSQVLGEILKEACAKHVVPFHLEDFQNRTLGNVFGQKDPPRGGSKSGGSNTSAGQRKASPLAHNQGLGDINGMMKMAESGHAPTPVPPPPTTERHSKIAADFVNKVSTLTQRSFLAALADLNDDEAATALGARTNSYHSAQGQKLRHVTR